MPEVQKRKVELMRGVESTTTIRAYKSDARLLKKWCGILNHQLTGNRRTTTDLLRHIFEENRRMKQRIKYMEYVTGDLSRQVKQLQSDMSKCRRF